MPESSESQEPTKPEDKTPYPEQKLWPIWFWWFITPLKKLDGLITALATVLLAIITGLLGLIAYWQYQELRSTDQTLHDTLIASTRAWIAPETAILKIEANIPPEITILYFNTGKSPAFGFNYDQTGGDFPIAANFKDWKNIPIPKNRTCDGLLPLNGAQTVFPSSANLANDLAFDLDITPPEGVGEIMRGERILWLNGCFAYRTMGDAHQSGFCFFLLPEPLKPFAKWRMKKCPSGHTAN